MVANTPERHQKVVRSPIRVPATPLRAQHSNHARDHRREPEQNMDPDYAQKDWIIGRYRDAKNDCSLVCHASFPIRILQTLQEL